MTDTPMAKIDRDLAAGRIVVLDGGIGTELQRRGAGMHPDVWCATATLEHPGILRSVHEDYIRAGSRIVTANTFSSSRNMLGPAGLGDRFEELISRSVELALEARHRVGASEDVAVAGSISHIMPQIHGTDDLDPNAIPPLEVVRANQFELAEALAKSGADFILLEMMSDPALAAPSIEAALSVGLPVWMGYACRRGTRNEPVSYSAPSLSIEDMLQEISPRRVSVAGIMHTNACLITDAVNAVAKQYDGPLMAYPDSGHFKMPNWDWTDAISPADFARSAMTWIDGGVQIIGGCCGLGVDHIEALTQALGTRRHL